MSAPAKRKGPKGSDTDLTRSITSLGLNRLPSRGHTRRLEELLAPRSASNPNFTMSSAKRVGSDDVDKRYTVSDLVDGDLRPKGIDSSTRKDNDVISEELKLPVLETNTNLTKSTQDLRQEISSRVPAIFVNDSVDGITSLNTKTENISDGPVDVMSSSSDVTQIDGSSSNTTNRSGFTENRKRVEFSSKPKQWTKLRHAHKVIHKNAYQIAKSNIPPFVQIETLHAGDIFVRIYMIKIIIYPHND